MYFETLSDFFAMGGHGFYVWLAYGTTLVVLAANYAYVRSTLKSEQRKLQWRESEDQS